MKLWVTSLTFLGFALVQSATIPNCPTFCECVVTGEAKCTKLDIEPFPTDEITRLVLQSPTAPLDLTGPTFINLRLTKLRELTVENATVTKLDASLFTATHLERLILRHSKIPVINKQLFKNSQYIRQVDLSYSTISVFEGIHSPYLDELILIGCNFKSLPQGALSPKDLPALSYLSLEDNQLQEIKLGDLSGAQINLANNQISQLVIEADEDLKDLVSLRLDNNPLSTIEAKDEVDLDELYVKGCHLTDLDFLNKFTSLTRLDATNNLIFSLDSRTLNKLDALEVLDLSQNLIRELPSDFGRVMSLTSLILDKNNLKTLPKFMFQGALDKFSCNGCNLTELHPQTFEQMRDTRVISLADNKLKTIPEDLFKPVVALTKVDLSHNNLTSLPADIFKHNAGLKIVYIRFNQLKEVDPMIFAATSLEELYMDFCGLTKLWAPATKIVTKGDKALLSKLKTLSAVNNSITELGPIDMKIAKVQNLNLQNNPISCSDSNINFIWDMSNLGFNFLHSTYCEDLTDDYSDEDGNVDYTDPEVLDDKSKEIVFNSKSVDIPDSEDATADDDDTNEDSYDDDDDDDDEDEDDDEDIDDQNIDLDENIKNLSKGNNANQIPKSSKKTKEEIDDFLQDADDVSAIEYYKFQARQKSSKQMLLFVLPTLVFVLTAMVVLLLTVTIILCVMQKRNGRPTNAPQITILPWGNSQKIKKHSGSIYRPLSEEKIPV